VAGAMVSFKHTEFLASGALDEDKAIEALGKFEDEIGSFALKQLTRVVTAAAKAQATNVARNN